MAHRNTLRPGTRRNPNGQLDAGDNGKVWVWL